MNEKSQQSNPTTVRLDRWLWAARFFKTRAIAKQAIEGGKVHLNGQRSKAGRTLQGGEILAIRKEFDIYTVEVIGLAEKRGPAKLARTLYEESDESLILRQKAAELRRINQLSMSPSSHKPDKKQRRKIHQFKQSQSD